MNIGQEIEKDGKKFYVREIDGDEAVIIEDGLIDPEPRDPNFEPDASHTQRVKIADYEVAVTPVAEVPVTPEPVVLSAQTVTPEEE